MNEPISPPHNNMFRFIIGRSGEKVDQILNSGEQHTFPEFRNCQHSNWAPSFATAN